jgi:integrase
VTVSLAPGFLYAVPRGELWAIRNSHRNVWTPAQQQAGVASSLYDLRHTFASRLLAAGIPLVEVSAWMGHLRAGGHERFHALLPPPGTADPALPRALIILPSE